MGILIDVAAKVGLASKAIKKGQLRGGRPEGVKRNGVRRWTDVGWGFRRQDEKKRTSKREERRFFAFAVGERRGKGAKNTQLSYAVP